MLSDVMSKSEKFCYHSFGTNETEKIIDVVMVSSLGKDGNVNPMVKDYGMVRMDVCHPLQRRRHWSRNIRPPDATIRR